MIIGGQAVLIYGEPRLTKDIDVTLALDSNGLASVLPIVSGLDLIILTEEPHVFVRRTSVLPAKDPQSGIRVDFVFSFTPYERQAIEHAKKIKFGDVEVAFATAEDILIHKIFSGRPRDIEDVRSILRKNKQHDFGYVKKWLKDFDDSFQGNFVEMYDKLLSETE